MFRRSACLPVDSQPGFIGFDSSRNVPAFLPVGPTMPRNAVAKRAYSEVNIFEIEVLVNLIAVPFLFKN